MNYNLEEPIFHFGGSNNFPYTLRNLVEGTCIWGSVGSGKSSGSGRFYALKMLKAGFGGLVLTAKPDEKEQWVEYCRLANRSKDLLILEPGGKYSFDFMSFLSSGDKGDTLTANLREVLKTVINAGEQKNTGKNNDPFWEQSLDQLIANAIDLSMLAYNRVDVQTLYDIVQTAPHAERPVPKPEERNTKAFYRAYGIVKKRVKTKVEKWYNGLHWAHKARIEFDGTFDKEVDEVVPEAKALRMLDQFFLDNFRTLASKTRSIVEFSFTGLLYSLLREPFYSLFCKQKVDLNPRLSLDGKIILLNLPTKQYFKVGRDCQILYKYLWQREIERRDIKLNGRPVFLFADEAYSFTHEKDPEFQFTARSSRVATVYIAQNHSQYTAAMGGEALKAKVEAFLGTLNTHIWHANSHLETNKAASDLIGEAVYVEPSRSITVAKDFSRNESISLALHKQVRPEEFVGLITGGARNQFLVEAYIHVQGDKLFNGQNFRKVKFNQNYQ